MKGKNTIYLNNAATTFPKPQEVKDAVLNALDNFASAGRGSDHGITNAENLLLKTRKTVAKLFNIDDVNRVIFTQNCTEAINYAIKGVLKKGDHVIMDNTAHNSVVRPLLTLEKKEIITISKVNPESNSYFDIGNIKQLITKKTKLVAISHASNVTGIIQDIGSIGSLLKNTGVLFLVDAAQSSGQIPIDVNEMNIDLLATAGHKSLYGPTGTGLLYTSNKASDLETIKEGGTGSDSEFLLQPTTFPQIYETGTHNIIGIAGLLAGIEFILSKGLEKIRNHKIQLTQELIDEIKNLSAVKIHGELDAKKTCGIVSITLDNYEPNEVSAILTNNFNIITRAGLHCAPLAHDFIGTRESGGTVRLSPGYFNTSKDVQYTIDSLRMITLV